MSLLEQNLTSSDTSSTVLQCSFLRSISCNSRISSATELSQTALEVWIASRPFQCAGVLESSSMLSYGEVLFTLAAAAALFGPKDIPIIARAAGRFVGKAVGYIQSARGQLDGVMKRSQVDQVRKDLQETMAQLEAIRYEIRSGMSISSPGPLTRSVLNIDIKPDTPGSPSMQTQTGAKDGPTFKSGTHINFSETWTGPVSDTKKVVLEMQDLHRHSWQSRIDTSGSGTVSTSTTTVSPKGFQPGPDGTFGTMPASTERIAARRVAVKPVGVAPATSPQLTPNPTAVQEDIIVLPISAVSAGLLSPTTVDYQGEQILYWSH